MTRISRVSALLKFPFKIRPRENCTLASDCQLAGMRAAVPFGSIAHGRGKLSLAEGLVHPTATRKVVTRDGPRAIKALRVSEDEGHPT